MAYSVLHTLRRIFFSITMFGMIVWHSSWLASFVTILNYVIPAAAILAIVNELVLALYLARFFEKVQAHVVPKEDTEYNAVPVKNYDLVFEYQGASYSLHQSDSVFGTSINNNTSCQVLVHKRPPRIALVDTFSQRYMYLILSAFLLWSLYTMYRDGM